MKTVTIRKSGGAFIVSIPASVIREHQLDTGSKLEFDVEDNRLIFTPIERDLTLEEVLAGSPKSRLAIMEEDVQWQNMKPIGDEF